MFHNTGNQIVLFLFCMAFSFTECRQILVHKPAALFKLKIAWHLQMDGVARWEIMVFDDCLKTQ
jgi:hypothetical protein